MEQPDPHAQPRVRNWHYDKPDEKAKRSVMEALVVACAAKGTATMLLSVRKYVFVAFDLPLLMKFRICSHGDRRSERGAHPGRGTLALIRTATQG